MMWKKRGKFDRVIEDFVFREREVSSIVFWRYLGSAWKCFVLCCIVVQSWLIESSDKFISMMNFTIWVVVCLIFLWMFQWKDFCLHILTKKRKNRLFPFFHQHLVCCVFVVNRIGKIDDLFIFHIFISFLNCVTRIAWVYWETRFLIVFFLNQRIPSGGSSVPGGTIWSSS